MPYDCKVDPGQRRYGCRRRRGRGVPAAAALSLLLAWLPPALPAEGLAGRIWVPAEERFARPGEVEEAVADAGLVLLGETHTLAPHHELQARLIRAAARDRRPAVVLEMLPRTAQEEIDTWRRDGADPDAFGAAVGWEERGWPEWSIYAPIARAALERDLPLYAGGAAPDDVRSVGADGLEALDASTRRALGLEAPLPDAARRQLESTLVAVHCGLPEHAPLDRMLAVQRLRDASMAARMRETARDHGAVLITGNGHARRDYGVPHYLASRPDGARVVSVAFMAAGGGRSLEEQRLLAGGSLPFDYVWFTTGEPPLADCDEVSGGAAD